MAGEIGPVVQGQPCGVDCVFDVTGADAASLRAQALPEPRCLVVVHRRARHDLVDQPDPARVQNASELSEGATKVGVHEDFLAPKQSRGSVLNRQALGRTDAEAEAGGNGRLPGRCARNLHMTLDGINAMDDKSETLRKRDRVSALATTDVDGQRTRRQVETGNQLEELGWACQQS